MAILTRPRFLPQQRLDLEDINALLAALRTDSKLYTKQLLSANNLIFKGFSVTGIGLKQATVAMADATLVIPQNSNDFSWFTAAPSEANIIIPDADLVDGVRNYVEIILQTENNTPLTKAFWDLEANSGLGSEFNQIVATITDLSVKMVVSTGGFSGSVDRLPLCIIDTDGSGNIKTILDRRNLFGRLGTPVNINNRYSWGARLEPAYTMQLNGTAGVFVAGELVTIGTETATVLTGGTTSITFMAPSGINFFPGNAVTGGTSGATATVNTIAESFIGADKNLKTQKDINDALMSEIALVKGTRYWFQDPQISLAGIVKSLESVLTQATATAKFAWDGTNLKITDDNVTPANDTLGYIRILGRNDDLALTREDGTGGTSSLAIADGEVLYVKITASGSRTFSAAGSGDTNFQVAAIGTYQSADTTYWLAYREGTRLYIRGYGELEPGEEINIGDPELEEILAAIAVNQNIETQDRNIKLIEGGTVSYVEVTGTTPVTPLNFSTTTGSYGESVLRSAPNVTAFGFTVANTTDITNIMIRLNRGVAGAGNISFELRNLSGVTIGSLIKTSATKLVSSLSFSGTSNLETFTFSAGTIPAGTYVLIPILSNGADVVSFANYSGNPSVNILQSTNNGSTYAGGTANLYIVVNGTEAAVSANNLTFGSDAFIQVPGLLRARNRIAAQTIDLPNATSVAYVDINRSGVTPAALTIVVANEDAITNNINRVVIARKVTAGVLVGNKSFLLKNGERLEIDGALAEINRYMGQLKIGKHTTNVSKAIINPADSLLLNGNTLSQMVDSLLMKFTGATINFTTGAVLAADDVTALGTNFTPFTIPPGQYFWYGISLISGGIDSDNTQNILVQVDLADSASASQSAALKPTILGKIKLGAIQVQNIAGTTTIVDVKPLGVGSGGSGGGGSEISLILGENLPINTPVYVAQGSSDAGRIAGRAYNLNNTDDYRINFVGFTGVNGVNGQNIKVKTSGVVTGLSGLTSGLPVYFDSGVLTQTVPTTYNTWQITVGLAISATELLINPDQAASAIFITDPATGGDVIANNQITDAAISGLLFDGSLFRSFIVEYWAYRTTDINEVAEAGEIRGVYATVAATWAIAVGGVAGDAGLNFNISSSGQITYTSSNLAGTTYVGNIKFVVKQQMAV